MFVIDAIIGIVLGIVLLKWSNQIAGLLEHYVGTNIIRDIGNPFVIKILGVVSIVGSIVTLILPFNSF